MKAWMGRSYRELMEYKKFRSKYPRVKLKEVEIPIFPGDFVQVMKGPEIGKCGRVLAVYRSLNWIYVRALNMRTVRYTSPEGKPVHISYERPFVPDEIQLLDPDNGNKPTKVNIVTTPRGNKFRVTQAGNTMFIPRDGDPDLVGPYAQIPAYREGPYDTRAEVVLEKSYRLTLNTVEEELLLKHKDYIQQKLREGKTGRINTLPRIPKNKWITNEYIPPYLEVVKLESQDEIKKKVKLVMSVHTSNPPSVAGPRTPYALYPELTSQKSGMDHKGFLWRAGYKRQTEAKGRYTSEYQRQFQPVIAGQREVSDLLKERKNPKVPVVDVREVLKEVERPELIDREVSKRDAPEPIDREVTKAHTMVPVDREVSKGNIIKQGDMEFYKEERPEIDVPVHKDFIPHNIPDKSLEVVGRQKRSKKIRDKRGAKRTKKERVPSFPLSEYQSQFQGLGQQSSKDKSFPIYKFPVKHSSYESQPALVPAPVRPVSPSNPVQRSPRRWSSEYRSNYSLRTSSPDKANNVTNPWYQMVIELREKARVYRDRGRSSALEHFQLPLCRRYAEVADSSRLSSNRSVYPQDEGANIVEEEQTNRVQHIDTSARGRVCHNEHKDKSPVDQLGSSLSKLNVTTPITNQLTELEPHTSQLHKVTSNTMRSSVVRHKPLSPPQHEAIRARTAVPPIDINRVHSYSPIYPVTHSSPNYLPASVPHSALSQTDTSLQTQLFKYKEDIRTPEPDEVSVSSAASLASHTLERAKHRQTFWK
ncbi:39S ribosomal protein L24, mitochondrial precursor [Oopsacas minuta]|uniref:39S ribosomal protein L24, mitochondrial n=1 Tax=Oopsacas minuta TaxID=111878 RepID=A0AAV7JD77_9METZ|nr:39S ribosomal protein L24, mitochondrial precursor [Oopsacas minuta]